MIGVRQAFGKDEFMKLYPKKLLTLLLAGLLALSSVGCATGGDDPADTLSAGDTTAIVEDETKYVPDIEKTDYDCEFVITGSGNIRKWSFAEEDSKGDPFQDSIYERALKIRDHLGVTLVEVDAGSWTEYSASVLRTIQAGDDAYQLIATQTYEGVPALMSSGAMYDFAELEGINLDAPYWAFDYMEGLTIQDQYLLGYNDYCLAATFCMVFNQDLTEHYSLTAPYNDVVNKTWTLDKMISFVSTVSQDNGDNVWDENDTYGITGWGWTDLIAFVQSSDMRIVDRDEDGDYMIAYSKNNEKTLALLEKLDSVYQANYSYFWTPYTSRDGKELQFGSGKSLVQLMQTTDLTKLRSETVRFGILPYPLYDEKQAEYSTLNWNGNIMVPSTVKNPLMVGQTIELLAYYSEPVKVAYFEDLLGSKLADSPEDAEMLEIIWSSQVSDAGVITANLGNRTIDYMLYMVPQLCRDGVGTYSSFLKKYERSSNNLLDRFFHPRTKT